MKKSISRQQATTETCVALQRLKLKQITFKQFLEALDSISDRLEAQQKKAG